MAVYELSKGSFYDFINHCVNMSKNDFNLSSEEITTIFMSNTDEIPISDKIEDETWWKYNNNEPSQLHVGQYHIRLNDIAKDFIEETIGHCLIDVFAAQIYGVDISMPVVITKNLILLIKKILKQYIVHMNDTEYEIYMIILKNLKSSQRISFTDTDINSWFFFGKQDGFDANTVSMCIRKMTKEHIYNYNDETGSYEMNI